MVLTKEQCIQIAREKKDTKEDAVTKGWVIGHTPFTFYVSVIVDMNTGEVYIDPIAEKTKLPAEA